MKLISPLLKRVVYPSLSRSGLLRWLAPPGLAIVTYHGTLPPGYEPVDATLDGNLITTDMLQRQLRLLKAHYNVISPEDLLAWREGRHELPQRAVLLTCDDGLLNCLTDMLPVLQQEGVSCLFFVTGSSAEESRTKLWYEELFLLFLRAPAGRFDISCKEVAIRGDLGSREQRREVWWSSVKQLSQATAETRSAFLHTARSQFGLDTPVDSAPENSSSQRRFALLTARELRELAAAGMTIGAHTLSHPMLSQAPADIACAEIWGCKTKLESVLHQRVWAFAYPFGDPQSVTPRILEMAREADFAAAFLNFGGGLGAALPAHALPRVHVTANMTLDEFEAHVSGFYARLQKTVGRNSQGFGIVQAQGEK